MPAKVLMQVEVLSGTVTTEFSILLKTVAMSVSLALCPQSLAQLNTFLLCDSIPAPALENVTSTSYSVSSSVF